MTDQSANLGKWVVSPEDRAAMLRRQIEIAKGFDDDAGPKEQIAAFKAVLAADSQNDRELLSGIREQKKADHARLIELGPVTETTLEDHRAVRFARIAAAMRE